MRKRKESSQQVELTRADKWRLDEAGVRAGICSFYVKYLGCCEVFESRGMQVNKQLQLVMSVLRNMCVNIEGGGGGCRTG